MDTIQIKVKTNFLKDLTSSELEKYKYNVEHYFSPYGYSYIDVLSQNDKGFILKVSFPRFFAGNNAYLISNCDECLEVQNHLTEVLKEIFLVDCKIELQRVDIPFTYMMSHNEKFTSYIKIFRLLAFSHSKQYSTSTAKLYKDVKRNEEESFIFSDTKSISGYNKKIMIYNQYENLKTKLVPEEFSKCEDKYGDLKRRIRIEVSRRIRIKPFSLSRFKGFNILYNYSMDFKKDFMFILDDKKIMEEILEENTVKLIERLKEARKRKDFQYKIFILENIDLIYDYSMIKKAYKEVIENTKTRESALKITKEVLEEYSAKNNIIIVNTLKKMKEMSEELYETKYSYKK